MSAYDAETLLGALLTIGAVTAFVIGLALYVRDEEEVGEE